MAQKLNILFWSVFLILLYCLFQRPIETGDVWWHLSAGRWILDHAAVPQTNVFPFDPTDAQQPWILTQWLGSTLLYMVYQWGGLSGLIQFRALLCLTMILIFLHYSRQKIPAHYLIVLTVLLFYGLSTRLLVRPALFNFIFTQILLILLFNYRQSGNPKILYPLPCIGVLWGNIHLGSFIYGLPIITVFLGAFVVEWLVIKTSSIESRRRVRHLTAIACLYLASFLVNPYALQGFLHPFKILFLPDYIHFYQTLGFISEQQSPWVYLSNASGIPFYFLTMFSLWAIYVHKSNRILYILLFVLASFIFMCGSRGSAFFTIVTVYIITEFLAFRAIQNAKLEVAPISGLFQNTLALTVIILLGLRYSESIKRGNLAVYPKNNPVSAVQFLNEHNIQGPMFNVDSHGGYILWTSYPRLKPFVDGRQLNQNYFFSFIQILHNPEAYWPAAHAQHQFKIVLLEQHNPTYQRLAIYLNHHAAWKPIYQDQFNTVYQDRN